MKTTNQQWLSLLIRLQLPDIVAISNSGADLRETTREVLALELIGRTAPELATDPVAMREFSDRLDAAKRAQRKVLDSFFQCLDKQVGITRERPDEFVIKENFRVRCLAS